VLTRDGVVVPIAPRTFDLLVILVRKGRLLSKGELLRIIWGDVNVEEASLAFQVSSLRKLLSDEGTSHPPQSGISQAANHGMGVLTSFPQPTLRSPGSWLAAGARPQDLRGLDAPLAERIGARTSEILGISGLAGFQTPQSTTPDQHLHLRARRSTGASRVGSTSTPCEGLARTTSLSAFTRAASFFRFNLAST
jgi:hypothetical protein